MRPTDHQLLFLQLLADAKAKGKRVKSQSLTGPQKATAISCWKHRWANRVDQEYEIDPRGEAMLKRYPAG